MSVADLNTAAIIKDNARGANNARLVECQRVDWDASGYVGPDVWAELPIGTLVLGDPKVTDEYFPA